MKSSSTLCLSTLSCMPCNSKLRNLAWELSEIFHSRLFLPYFRSAIYHSAWKKCWLGTNWHTTQIDQWQNANSVTRSLQGMTTSRSIWKMCMERQTAKALPFTFNRRASTFLSSIIGQRCGRLQLSVVLECFTCPICIICKDTICILQQLVCFCFAILRACCEWETIDFKILAFMTFTMNYSTEVVWVFRNTAQSPCFFMLII